MKYSDQFYVFVLFGGEKRQNLMTSECISNTYYPFSQEINVLFV